MLIFCELLFFMLSWTAEYSINFKQQINQFYLSMFGCVCFAHESISASANVIVLGQMRASALLLCLLLLCNLLMILFIHTSSGVTQTVALSFLVIMISVWRQCASGGRISILLKNRGERGAEDVRIQRHLRAGANPSGKAWIAIQQQRVSVLNRRNCLIDILRFKVWLVVGG